MRNTVGLVSRMEESVALGWWTAVGEFMTAIVAADPDRSVRGAHFSDFALYASSLPVDLLGEDLDRVLHGG